MLYVIYRMTVIYNPNTGIIAKIIFKIEIKKKIRSLKATIVVLQSVLSAHLSFWFVLRWETEAPSSLPEWLTKKSLLMQEKWAGSCECNGVRRVVLTWHFAVFGVWVMSMGWTILNGTLTDWNLYDLYVESYKPGPQSGWKCFKQMFKQVWQNK